MLWLPSRTDASERECSCGFAIWQPLAATRLCTVGFYDDWRFPGRLIVSLNRHFESVEEVPGRVLSRFVIETQAISKVQRAALAADRVNIAILGNQEVHVHAHLVPRLYAEEPAPGKAPWEDPRPRGRLDASRASVLRNRLTQALAEQGRTGRPRLTPVIVDESEHAERASSAVPEDRLVVT